jgi:hypothetical protein
MNKMCPVIQVLVRCTYVHTDIISETTSSYSGVLKICESIKTLRVIFSTVPVLFRAMYKRRNRDSSVGTAMGYRLDGLGSIPRWQDFSLLHSIQAGISAY